MQSDRVFSFVGLLFAVASYALGPVWMPVQEAQEPTEQVVEFEFDDVEVNPTEIDAVVWAFDALLQYPEDQRQYIRFLWLPPWADEEWPGVIRWVVNSACSHSRVLYRGDLHAGGWMMAFDLSQLAQGEQLVELVRVWDSLAEKDPYFHVPGVNVQVDCETCKGIGKLRYTRDGKEEIDACNVCGGSGKIQSEKTTAILAPHLDAALARHVTDSSRDQRVDVLVTQMTQSTGAIYRADWFLDQAFTSLGGVYPEFRQIKWEDGLKKHLEGAGYSIESAIAVGGEKGALLLISEVTGKSRIVLVIFGVAGRAPLVVTFDAGNERTRPDEQFIRNVFEFQPFTDAGEVFVPMPNGLIEYLLVDGSGNFQRSAPDNIVADSIKPDGHTKQLEMGVSCALCHAPNDGYNTAKNDMEFVLGSDVDFIGEDFSYRNGAGQVVTLTREAAIDTLAGRFGERIDEPDGLLGRARRDYSRAVSRLTDYTIDADGPSPVARVGLKLKEILHRYNYRRVNAEMVCLELGVRVAPARSLAVLREIVPPAPVGQQEDILISLLRNGAEIKREDLEAIYGEMARRAVLHRPAFTGVSE